MMKRYFTGSVSWNETEVVNAIRRNSTPLDDDASTDALLQRIGEARIVMLGESSQGTHEYYTWIEQKHYIRCILQRINNRFPKPILLESEKIHSHG